MPSGLPLQRASMPSSQAAPNAPTNGTQASLSASLPVNCQPQPHLLALPKVRPHPMRQTTTPAPASGGGSWPSCSSAPAATNAPGLLMLFQVIAIQPSERWTCEMRNSSMWPLKGSAIPLTLAAECHVPLVPRTVVGPAICQSPLCALVSSEAIWRRRHRWQSMPENKSGRSRGRSWR